MKPLISISEAQQLIRSQITTAQSELVDLNKALGRVLTQELVADRAIPPFDRAMMDGIAMDSSEFFGIGTELRIAGIQAAGSPALEKILPNTCFEVMTGATLPAGCDCVVPIEEISITKDSVIFSPDADVEAGKFVHREASDSLKGDSLLPKGTQLGPNELAVAASIGTTQLHVSKLPKVHIISSGDEVIPPDETPLSYQIRQSHPTALISLIEGAHLGTCLHSHISDDPTESETVIKQALQSADILVFTGGISKGKFDYIAPTLTKLLGEAHFHGVKQRPGKPFGFWKKMTSPAVFALPGNPASVMTTATCYLIPALKQHLKLSLHPTTRELAIPLDWKAPISGFVAVSIDSSGKALPLLTKNSGDYLGLIGADGFLQLNEPRTLYPAGTQLSFFPIH